MINKRNFTSNDLQRFDFQGNDISVLIDESGNPWFISSEICSVLEISNPRQAITNLDDDEKSTVHLNDGRTNNPNRTFISESGLYSLVMGSRKVQAKPFKKWVTSDVLPTIRKTGSYTLPKQLTPAQMLLQQAQAMVLMESQLAEVKEEIAEVKAKITSSPNDYFAVAGYASLIHKPIDVKTAAELGRKAAAMCKNLGYTTHSMPDPRFGSVKLYPIEILKTVFEQKNL